MTTSDIYDMAFKDEAYNDINIDRISQVKHWIDKYELDNLLDVGCGRGHYLKALPYTITGLEPSKYLCDNELKDMNVINGEITTFKPKKKYSGLYCMDVLEHISESDIDDSLKALAKLAPRQYLGIAYHSDVKDGIELHLIQQPRPWWEELLKKYYPSVACAYEVDRYFIFEVASV